MKKFRNIASLFDFRGDYQFLGNLGQCLYLWGVVDLSFMALNLEEISRTIRDYGAAGFYTGAIIGDMVKMGGGIAMKYYKRNQITKEDATQQKISGLERKVNQ